MNITLNDYIARNPVNARIAENMVDLHILSEGIGSFEDMCCHIFSNAYDIIKDMIQSSPASIWKIPDYYKKSASRLYDNELHKVIAGATFSVVLILVEHFDEKWISENQKFLDKMKDYLGKIYLSGETINIAGNEIVNPLGGTTKCISAYRSLRRGTDIDYKIPIEEFLNPLVGQISKKADKYVTREEQKKIIQENVKAALENYFDENSPTDEDIKEEWNQALSNAKAEIRQEIPRFEYDAQKRCLNIVQDDDRNARIAELEKENAELKAKLANQPVESNGDNNEKQKNITQQLAEKEAIIKEQERLIEDYSARYDPKDIKKRKVSAMTGKQHIILFLSVLAHHKRLPNSRKTMSSLMSFIASRNQSTMEDYLGDAISKEECENLAKVFDNEKQFFIARLIRELPEKLENDKKEKNRTKALKKTND